MASWLLELALQPVVEFPPLIPVAQRAALSKQRPAAVAVEVADAGLARVHFGQKSKAAVLLAVVPAVHQSSVCLQLVHANLEPLLLTLVHAGAQHLVAMADANCFHGSKDLWDVMEVHAVLLHLLQSLVAVQLLPQWQSLAVVQLLLLLLLL